MMRRLTSLTATLLLAALLAACHVAPAPDSDKQLALTGGEWLLTEIAGQKIETQAEQRAYLEFNADNRVSGSGGCNRIVGEYRLASGQLHFSRLVSTRMACIDMRTEDALLAALPIVTSYALSGGGDVLTLYKDDGAPLATFRRDAGGGEH